MKTIKLVIVLSAAAAFIAACGQAPKNNTATANAQPEPVASPGEPAKPVDELATGRELYAVNCQVCHRQTGVGGAVTVEGKKLKTANLTSDRAKQRDDAHFITAVTDGAPDDGMPAFKDKLSAEQIQQIVKYVRTLQTPLANS
jgi:mono/diheme cytochrome c family protein